MLEAEKPGDKKPESDPLAPLLQWLESGPRARVFIELEEDDDGQMLVCVEGCREQLDPDFEVPQGIMAHFRVSMLLEHARKHGIGPIISVLGDLKGCRIDGPDSI